METRYQGRQKNRVLCPRPNYTKVTCMNWLKGILIFFFFCSKICCWLCWVFTAAPRLSLVAASGAYPLVVVYRLFKAVASLVVEHRCSRACGLQELWLADSVEYWLSRFTACGIFPDRGSNPHTLSWQADS